MRYDECFEISEQLCVPAEGKLGVDALLGRAHPELLQADDVGLGEFLVGKVGQDWSAPQRIRRRVPRGCAFQISACGCGPAVGHARFESEHVDLRRIEREHVARGLHHDDLGRAERLAHLRDHALQRVGHSGRWIVVPQAFGEVIRRDDVPALQSEHRQHGSELRPRHGPRDSIDAVHLQRPEKSYFQGPDRTGSVAGQRVAAR